MHRPCRLQGSLKRRYKHLFPTSINGYHTVKMVLAQSPTKRPTFAFMDEIGYIHTRLSEKNRTQRLTRRNRAHFGLGAITTLGTFRTFTNIPGPGIRTAYFAALGAWSRVLPKNAKSLRDSDALMRVAVPRRRGPAGLRDLFRFCRNRDLYIRRSWFSACARHGWYHYPRCALCAVEIPDGRLSKGLICRFLRSDGCRSLYGIFSDISARKIRL